ncbi:hypothetical protein EJ03DRAFT_357594 [Teratosphaeria nubilosa]|uniref:Uncharacterized protein n=1 Tax=Teratosphaeria nubilosa TaxID=161662 RepID=A0A6G1KWF4_9PEZI|nr:hypothetical protein EJ03DRAFT_357594 [Teratosphaeria nubilosa]
MAVSRRGSIMHIRTICEPESWVLCRSHTSLRRALTDPRLTTPTPQLLRDLSFVQEISSRRRYVQTQDQHDATSTRFISALAALLDLSGDRMLREARPSEVAALLRVAVADVIDDGEIEWVGRGELIERFRGGAEVIEEYEGPPVMSGGLGSLDAEEEGEVQSYWRYLGGYEEKENNFVRNRGSDAGADSEMSWPPLLQQTTDMLAGLSLEEVDGGGEADIALPDPYAAPHNSSPLLLLPQATESFSNPDLEEPGHDFANAASLTLYPDLAQATPFLVCSQDESPTASPTAAAAGPTHVLPNPYLDLDHHAYLSIEGQHASDVALPNPLLSQFESQAAALSSLRSGSPI